MKGHILVSKSTRYNKRGENVLHFSWFYNYRQKHQFA